MEWNGWSLVFCKDAELESDQIAIKPCLAFGENCCYNLKVVWFYNMISFVKSERYV